VAHRSNWGGFFMFIMDLYTKQIFMAARIEEFTRAEYELLYSAFKSYRVYMTKEEEVMSEKILDKVFYPSFDALQSQSPFMDTWEKEQQLLVEDAEEALRQELTD
tara:strand:+ start:219 stop:533 length:315 start_codon:yes stop_codon:yes gene_type:complete